MASLIKIRLLQRLADLIQCEIKELKGHVCAGPASRDHKLTFPSLALIPQAFTFEPWQQDEFDYVRDRFYDVPPKTTAFVVGKWDGVIEFKLGEKTPFKRYELEAKLEELFLGTTTGTDPLYRDPYFDQRPGILLIDVPECYGARCALMLEGDQWENELAFANEWYSTLRVSVEMPAIITKRPVHSIDTLQFALTEDLETVISSPTALPSDTETVTIDADGNIT